MNEHAGPACALSGLIVGVFAILLHERNPTPPGPLAPVQKASPQDGSASKSETSASIQRAVPREVLARPTPAESAPIARPTVTRRVVAVDPAQPSPPRVPERNPGSPTRLIASGPPVKALQKLASKTSPSRSSFAIVGPGETLADVAKRVYGSKDAAEAIWKANRDQVEKRDAPLSAGTLLRTP